MNTTHPKAAQAAPRPKIKKVKKADGEVQELTVGVETIRSAACPKPGHGTSTSFEGVNSAGWIFACSGKPKSGEPAHRFIADPA